MGQQPPAPGGRQGTTLREVMTNVFAVVIVGLWAIATGRQIIWPTTESLQFAGQIGALLGPILGAVIGLYFGANAGERVAQQATQRASDALLSSATAKAKSQQELAAAGTDIEDALDAEEQAHAALDALKRENDQLRRQLRNEDVPTAAPRSARARPRNGGIG